MKGAGDGAGKSPHERGHWPFAPNPEIPAMSEETAIEERVEQLLADPVAGLGCRLLEVRLRNEGRWILRLVVDRDSGVNLDALGAVSELAGRLLDVEDPVPQAYALEVTSPGLFRPLKEKKQFEQSVGMLARLTLGPEFLPERKNRTLRGVITGVENGRILLELGGDEEDGGGSLEVPLEAIRKARLDPDI